MLLFSLTTGTVYRAANNYFCYNKRTMSNKLGHHFGHTSHLYLHLVWGHLLHYNVFPVGFLTCDFNCGSIRYTFLIYDRHHKVPVLIIKVHQTHFIFVKNEVYLLNNLCSILDLIYICMITS